MESFNKQEQLVELPTNGGQNSVVGEVQKRSRNKKNKTVNKVSNFQTRDDLTPLMRAATDKDCMVLLELLTKQNYSSSLFLKDRRGRTALDWARLSRNYVAVTLLTKAMSTNISNARLDAISYNNLDYQTYIVTTNNNSFHALYAAVKDRDSKTAMRILNDNLLYREEVEAIPVADGNSISSLGNSYGAGATSDNSQKKEVFFTDKELFHKNTLLILASGLNMLDVVYKLIELGTPIDHQNKYGHTALTYACCIGHAEVVRHLLHKGKLVLSLLSKT